MNSWTFIAGHLNDPAALVGVMAFLAAMAGLTIKKVAEQPFFGGRKRRGKLEEHYIHGEITTAEYEDRRSHLASAHWSTL